MDIAVSRLMYPTWLSESDAENYREHIRQNIMKVTELAVQPENDGWMQMLIREGLLDEAALDLALRLSSERKLTELTGMLMEYRHDRLKASTSGRLSLDELDIDF